MPNEPVTINQKSEFAEAFKAGKESEKLIHGEAVKIHRIDGGEPFLLMRDKEGEIEVQSLDSYALHPNRVRRVVTFTDVDSFTDYVNEFKDEGTRIFGARELSGAKFKAILDDHIVEGPSKLTPRRGLHVAIYSFPTTPEWQEIIGKNKQMIKQLEFAEMVERLRNNFVVPQPASMLELARHIEASSKGEFKSSFETDNGDRVLLYTETTEAVAGRAEKIPIPNAITLSVQPFVRGETYDINAIFRYRVSGGQVFFQYDLEKPHEFIDRAVEQVRATIEVDTTVKPLFGDA